MQKLIALSPTDPYSIITIFNVALYIYLHMYLHTCSIRKKFKCSITIKNRNHCQYYYQRKVVEVRREICTEIQSFTYR